MGGPTDTLGQLRAQIKEAADCEYPNGTGFSSDELRQILRAINAE